MECAFKNAKKKDKATFQVKRPYKLDRKLDINNYSYRVNDIIFNKKHKEKLLSFLNSFLGVFCKNFASLYDQLELLSSDIKYKFVYDEDNDDLEIYAYKETSYDYGMVYSIEAIDRMKRIDKEKLKVFCEYCSIFEDNYIHWLRGQYEYIEMYIREDTINFEDEDERIVNEESGNEASKEFEKVITYLEEKIHDVKLSKKYKEFSCEINAFKEKYKDVYGRNKYIEFNDDTMHFLSLIPDTDFVDVMHEMVDCNEYCGLAFHHKIKNINSVDEDLPFFIDLGLLHKKLAEVLND